MIVVSQKRGLVGLAVVLMLALAWLLYKTPPAEWDRARQLGEFIESKGLFGGLIFFIVTALSTAVGLPRQLFAFAAGFAFGVINGVLLSSFGAICGCAMTFYCSRKWLSELVLSRFPTVVIALNKLITKDTFLKILVLRLQPLGTNLITNLCAGVTVIPAKLFLTSSWLGYVPQMLIFCLLGAGVRINSNTYLLYSLSLLSMSLILGAWLFKRYTNQSADT